MEKWVPVFNPKDYDLKNNSIAEIIQVTCQAEVVHEIIMILSFCACYIFRYGSELQRCFNYIVCRIFIDSILLFCRGITGQD